MYAAVEAAIVVLEPDAIGRTRSLVESFYELKTLARTPRPSSPDRQGAALAARQCDVVNRS